MQIIEIPLCLRHDVIPVKIYPHILDSGVGNVDYGSKVILGLDFMMECKRPHSKCERPYPR